MESEKIKEIKKALECCSKGECGVWCSRFDKKNINHTCQDDMNADALTLINELESENDTLHTNLCEWRKENKQLKDGIAELENTDYYKEIEKKKEDLLCKEYSLIKYEKETAGKYLKEFAEKVKEKALSHCKTINCYELKSIEETIDELLEEYDK